MRTRSVPALRHRVLGGHAQGSEDRNPAGQSVPKEHQGNDRCIGGPKGSRMGRRQNSHDRTRERLRCGTLATIDREESQSTSRNARRSGSRPIERPRRSGSAKRNLFTDQPAAVDTQRQSHPRCGWKSGERRGNANDGKRHATHVGS